MAFPLTHLCVAYHILTKHPIPAPELFLLGSIAPDAVHSRAEFKGSSQSNIGPAKKVTHLCPISDEKWGRITDNDGWVESVKAFISKNPNNPLLLGYAVHVLTDIFNNKGLWHYFSTNYPEEAARGYNSNYYADLRNIDLRLYNEFVKNSKMMDLLKNSTSQDISGLIARDELEDIRNHLLNIAYADIPDNAYTNNYFYVTYDQTLEFINDAAEFCVKHLL